jgi:hypothetical protein
MFTVEKVIKTLAEYISPLLVENSEFYIVPFAYLKPTVF